MFQVPPSSDAAKESRGFIVLKAIAVLGFMTAANLVILYAC